MKTWKNKWKKWLEILKPIIETHLPLGKFTVEPYQEWDMMATKTGKYLKIYDKFYKVVHGSLISCERPTEILYPTTNDYLTPK